MPLKTKQNESQAADLGAIVIYQPQEGQSALDVRLKDETLWLALDQMAELFDRDKSVISRHFRNIFPVRGSCCKKCNNCRGRENLPSGLLQP